MNRSNNLEKQVNDVIELLKNETSLVKRSIVIGKTNPIKVVIMYLNGLIDKQTINKGIMDSLLFNVDEDLKKVSNIEEYVVEKYISISNTYVEKDIDNVIYYIKRGNTIIILENSSQFIIADTTGGEHRSVQDPKDETAIRGSREGFIENLDINISLIRRGLKDSNLKEIKLTVGKRAQKDVALMYIEDIADKSIVADVKQRLEQVDIDGFSSSGALDQFIESNSYSIFPQSFNTERTDVVISDLLQGKIAMIVDGTPSVQTFPAQFFEFFQAVEDYNQRTIIASIGRAIRYLAAFLLITLPAIYVTLIKLNPELIPLKFIEAIIEARTGIALTPFMSVLSMNIIVEFLREGGLRLPGKIGQTMSVVGGIIIGDAALKAKIVSSITLLVVGVATVATFLIPNYEMSLSLRVLGYPMVFLGNFLGIFGITIGWFFIIAYLSSLKNYGVPYFQIRKVDMKDMFIRAPLWKMNERATIIPNNNPIRQKDFRHLFRRKNGES